MECIQHFMYVVAIKDTKAWVGFSPAQLSMVGVWNLIVVWLKVSIPLPFTFLFIWCPSEVRTRGLTGRRPSVDSVLMTELCVTATLLPTGAIRHSGQLSPLLTLPNLSSTLSFSIHVEYNKFPS